MFAIPKCFNTYINIQWCVSQTQQNFIMFIIILGQQLMYIGPCIIVVVEE